MYWYKAFTSVFLFWVNWCTCCITCHSLDSTLFSPYHYCVPVHLTYFHWFPTTLHESVNPFLWNIYWAEFKENVISDLFSHLYVTYRKVFVVWSRFFPCIVRVASILFTSVCFSMMISRYVMGNWHGPTLTNVTFLLMYLCHCYLKKSNATVLNFGVSQW